MSDLELAVLKTQKPAEAGLTLSLMPRHQLMMLAQALRLPGTVTRCSNAELAATIAAALHPPASGAEAAHAPYQQESML